MRKQSWHTVIWLHPPFFSVGVWQPWKVEIRITIRKSTCLRTLPGQSRHPRVCMRCRSSLVPSHEWTGSESASTSCWQFLHQEKLQFGSGHSSVSVSLYSILSTNAPLRHLRRVNYCSLNEFHKRRKVTIYVPSTVYEDWEICELHLHKNRVLFFGDS